jgi:transposase
LDPARAYLIELVRQNHVTLASLSRALGRNHAYLHQFVHRGTPKRLPDTLRRELAELLGTSESALNERDDIAAALAGAGSSKSSAPGNFPARLAIARAQSRFPLPTAFAEAAGIDRGRYRSLEEGEFEPSLEELDKLSSTSGKSLEWLIRGT